VIVGRRNGWFGSRAGPPLRRGAGGAQGRSPASGARQVLRALAIGLGLASLSFAAAGAYHIEDVLLPPELRGGITAVAFTPGGSLVLTTRYGEVWLRTPDASRWRLFARGLNEPMGLVAESERVVYVSHRPELLRMSDTTGDGRADTFDAIGDWGITNNYHEFFFGLRRDARGHFYGALSLSSAVDKSAVNHTRGVYQPAPAAVRAGHVSPVPYRGWAIEMTADGTVVPFAAGFRQPAGVGMSPEGELFLTDNQGDYKPSGGLMHVARGDFHGHAESLKWEPGFEPGSLTPEALWRRYKSPAVVFPHGLMGVSSGEPVWDLTGGRFGPFAGQVFTGDFASLVSRSGLEKVAGVWQGFVFPFLGRNQAAPYATGARLAAGSLRLAFAPDGSLYIGQTAGWGGGADGMQRVVWKGSVPAEVKTVSLTGSGFRMTFTRPMDAALLRQPANYELSRFRFYYQVRYGSPSIDDARAGVREARPAADGLAVDLVLEEMIPGFVYELALPALRTAAGEPLANPVGYYTVNRLRNGEFAVGGTTRLPRPEELMPGAADPLADPRAPRTLLVEAGEKIYRTYCTACHQPDGRGLPGGAANFRDPKTREKSDAQLIEIIGRGSEAKGMPGFSSILNAGQRRSVLAYIRDTFGEAAPGAGP
jgi:mono/diheme cytochrome c family protein